MFVIKSIIIGIVGYVFANILIADDMIFGFYSRFLTRMREKGYLAEWIYKPLGGCSTCFTGQIAFWYYLVAEFGAYRIDHHIAFICIAILTEQILTSKFYGQQ